mmetsp:Transcript_105780/g.183869  ORF Transcript_105780/g.183869 Transcript_105780/m.183869 type:complete len:250 (+) Transcript_105780:86-835(+)
MAVAAKHWQSEPWLQSQDAAPQKRRRLSISDVESELHRNGLCQPFLSELRTLDHEVQASARSKRALMAEEHGANNDKRRRVSSSLCESDIMADTVQQAGGVIMPYSASRRYARWPPRSSSSRNPIAVDPEGIAFVMSPNGLLIAELPPHIRCVITAMGVRAKALCIDSSGTAYFLSEENTFVPIMHAVRSIKETHDDAARIQFLNSGSSSSSPNHKCVPEICHVTVEEVDDSSTDIPSSECGDADMDTD